MSCTVGRLARRFGLSRSALLYYDSIGLLTPEGRGQGEYRRYGEDAVRRLELICRYREAGLALKDIKAVLDSPDSALAGVMERRLDELNREIRQLHGQREFVLKLLKHKGDMPCSGGMNKKLWISLLEHSGFSEEDMDNWHRGFEASAPDKHQRFLEFLGIPEDEIRLIREYSAMPNPVEAPKA